MHIYESGLVMSFKHISIVSHLKRKAMLAPRKSYRGGVLFAFLLALSSSQLAFAHSDREIPIHPTSYSMNHPGVGGSGKDPDRNRDPQGTKLTDGDVASRIIWNSRHMRRHPVEITFNFIEPTRLSTVRLTFFRGKRSYGVKNIFVSGQLPTGEAVQLGSKTLNEPYDKPDSEPAIAAVDVAVESDQKISSVTVKVGFGFTYLSLSEVAFFAPVPTQADDDSSSVEKETDVNPFAHLGIDAVFGGNLRIEEKDFNNDGVPDILLENDCMLYVIEPAHGGVVNYAYDKQAKVNLVKYHDASSWGGLFCDYIKRDGKNASDWYNARYNYSIVNAGPDAITVRLWKDGVSGNFAMVSIDKTFTLTKDSASLRGDYRVKVSPDNVDPMELALFSFSAFGSAQENWRIFWPTPAGVMTCKTHESKNVWSLDPANGWTGFVTDSGVGAAIVHEYERMAAHHFWPVQNDSSVEVVFGQFPIKAGESFDTTLWFVPFYGLGVPDGASPLLVGQIVTAPEPYTDAPAEIEAKVKAAQAGTYSFTAEAKRLPSDTWEKLDAFSRVLTTAPAAFTIPFGKKQDGTYVIRVVATRDGQNALTMERSLVLGDSSGEFVQEPPLERLIPAAAEAKVVDLDFHSQEFETPHVKWAPSYAGGSPSVLFLVQGDKFAIREAVELGQRFDIRVHTSHIPRVDNTSAYWELADHMYSLGPEDYVKHLKKMLGADKAYDVLVIAGNYWKILDTDLQDNILERVKQGTGLVLLYPVEAPEDFDVALKVQSEQRFTALWKKEKEHFITTGIPFGALPPTLVFPSTSRGDILASANGKPLIATSALGKGRIVTATWDGGPLDRRDYLYKYGSMSLFPNLSRIGVGGAEFNYWEYQLSLLAKMIYYASDRVSPVGVDKIDVVSSRPEGETLQMKIGNVTDQPVNAELETIVRDKYYRVVSANTNALVLKEGANAINIPLPKFNLAGLHMIEARLLADGKTLWWGSVAFEGAAPATLGKPVLNEKIFRRDAQAQVAVTLEGIVPTGALIRIRAEDCYDRLFASVERPAVSGENTFVLPLVGSLGPHFNISAELIAADGSVIDETRGKGIVYQKPDLDRFNIMVGWPERLYRGNRFMVPYFYQMMVDLWGWNVSWAARRLSEQEADIFAECGIPLIISRAMGAGGKDPTTTVLGEGKYGLLREPCLSDPEFRQKLVESHRQPGGGEDRGAWMRLMPDEANSIRSWQGCFSEHCQKEFRVWLKNEYESLEALNKEWNSDYKFWDEVEAKLDTEVDKDTSIAPWLDHRTFNEWNYAHAFKLMNDGIKAGGVDRKIMMCGTQETRNYNAYDWYRLTQHVDAYAAYVGEQNILRSSFIEDYICYPWMGYGADLNYLRHRILSSMFNDNAKGYNILAMVSVNPDWSLHRTGKDLTVLKDDLSGGRAELIMRAKNVFSPIAFLYSPASVHVNSFYNLYDAYTAEITGAKDVLETVGENYRYIATEQLRQGGIDLDTTRLLFLPLSTALSEEMVENIEKFVAEGGTVVADFMPGGWTAHGRKLKKILMSSFLASRAKIRKTGVSTSVA